MEDIIKILPKYVANKIAAGEVIQRPASVVKELLENSIDANATIIDLNIQNSGKNLIQIIDNGKGMSFKDAKTSFKHHATSKIQTINDLFKIYTKGFRGEALASISSISYVELRTKIKDLKIGTRIIIEGGKIKEQIAIPQESHGSSFSIKHLFYNLPARRNFLKSNKIEFHHIIKEFYRIVLAHPKILFRLYHNSKTIFFLKSESYKERIIKIFGETINEQLVPILEETKYVTIKGFITKPNFFNKNRQFIFINNRYIKNLYLHKAILKAYQELLQENCYPSYFVFLYLDPKHIDININPTKTEVKFDNESFIFDILRDTIKHVLGQYQITKIINFKEKKNSNYFIDKDHSIFSKKVKNLTYKDSFFSQWGKLSETQNILPIQKIYEDIKESYTKKDNNYEKNLDNSLFHNKKFNKNINQFQIYRKYIITTLKFGLIIIDQHRAHQRILYEKFLNTLNKKIVSQQLLFPIYIPLPSQEIENVKNLKHNLFNIGFVLKFLKHGIEVLSIPNGINKENFKKNINSFIQEVFTYTKLKNKNHEESLAQSIAKFGSIKYGIKLNPIEIESLINELFICNNPNYSPFGESVFIVLSISFIEKQFHK